MYTGYTQQGEARTKRREPGENRHDRERSSLLPLSLTGELCSATLEDFLLGLVPSSRAISAEKGEHEIRVSGLIFLQEGMHEIHLEEGTK